MHFVYKLLLLPFLFIVYVSYSQSDNLESFTIVKQNKATSVKNQSQSGTCWSFATVSFLESELLRMERGEFDLSEMFIVRQIYPQKATMHVRMMGNNFFTMGGQAHNVLNTIRNFGIVPDTAFSGLADGQEFHNHHTLDSLLEAYVNRFVDKQGNELPPTWIDTVNLILDTHLGAPPKYFIYNKRNYPPKGFMDEVLKINPDDYLEICSFTHHPFYTPFILESRFNWDMQPYQNVPIAEFMEIIDNAIENGFTVAWDGDVSESTFNFWTGKATIPEFEGKVTQQLRQNTFDNHTTSVDHLMHITGIAKNQLGQKYYITKNSWGTNNPFNGYMYMSESYVKLKTIAIVVHKDAIPLPIAKKMNIK
jgi:bleomycin hydrolase